MNNFPLGSFATTTFGLRTGQHAEVVGHNYFDNTVVLYYPDGYEMTCHLKGIRTA